jgi:hypothetical protein
MSPWRDGQDRLERTGADVRPISASQPGASIFRRSSSFKELRQLWRKLIVGETLMIPNSSPSKPSAMDGAFFG